MARRKPLTAAFVQKVATPGKYCDLHGLILRVYPTGAKCWEQRYTLHGRRRTPGLGGFPTVSLQAARTQALENLALVRGGSDPIALKRRARVPTVTETFVVVLKARTPQWKNPKEPSIWRQRFDTYIKPRLGNYRVSDVRPPDALALLEPLYHTKTETGRRVRQILRTILDRAVTDGHLASNPAGQVISSALPRMKKTKAHFPALPHAEVGAALAAVRASAASLPTRLAFEFLVLTAARSGEVRKATWEEIDLKTKVWTVPEERMKVGPKFRVPLSPQATAVLQAARELEPAAGLVFPSPRDGALSDATLSVMLRKLKVKAVPHGFRSSFRDWCLDSGVNREPAELALAHNSGDATEIAYKRGDALELRRPIMIDWANYVTETAGPRDPSDTPEPNKRTHQQAARRARRRENRRRSRPAAPSGQGDLFEDAS